MVYRQTFGPVPIDIASGNESTISIKLNPARSAAHREGKFHGSISTQKGIRPQY
jgi:hypothetical protein